MTDQPAGSPQIPTQPYDDDALRRARDLLDVVPEMIGPFRILERIGGGGMGEVYRAEQRAPIRREVALKVIKLGMDTRTVIARFEAERQALALMDHPHIASIFDAGADETGRPYFVMEYVKGKPITEYADLNRLTISERLKLFEQVCQAVQHAHHKGIIHRDLKPSNILVSTRDGKPYAKVIDFGIAKATSQQLTEKTLFTRHDQFIGTPQYMSPEQAEGNIDIDTRTDVYSLGVLLYELLTGSPPFSATEWKLAAFEQLRKMIVEVDPPSPSIRLSQSGQTLPSLAACRKIDPGRLGSTVRGELDWIVMKALEKDRKRRYQTPAGLAHDIASHLHGEQVQAVPPSRGYRLRKLLKKYRKSVIAVLTVCMLLMIGICGTTWGLFRASQAEKTALAQFHEAEKHRQRADAIAEAERIARQSSEKRLGQLQKINEIFAVIFGDLNPDPLDEIGGISDLPPLSNENLRVTLGSRLNRAAAQLDGEAIGDPETVAELQRRLGKSLESLGYLDQALDLQLKAERTLVERRGDGLASINNLRRGIAYLQSSLGQSQNALATMQRAVDSSKARLGADHPVTLFNTHHLAVMQERNGNNDAAIQIFSGLLDRQRAVLGPYHLQTLNTQYKLGQTYGKIKQLDRALPLIETAVRDGREHLGLHHEVRMWIRHLASVYQSQGSNDQGVQILEELNGQLRKTLAPNHSDVNLISGSLADAYASQSQKQYSKAIPLYLDLIQKDRARFGFNHQKVFERMGKLAVCHTKSGDCRQGFQCAQEAVRLATDRYGPDHLFTIKLRLQVALSMACVEHDGIELLEDLILRAKKTEGIPRQDLFWPMIMLGESYARTGQIEKALQIYDDAIACSRHENTEREFKIDRVLKVISAEDRLAKALSDQGQHPAAVQCSDAALRHRRLIDGNSESQH
jgi:non-specific serine/threonine protein kinase/serine/threonine-protein kinase